MATLKELLLATNNPGKVREYQRLLGETGFRLVTPAEAGLNVMPAETGDTFARNAVIKAEALSVSSGLPALADDSGLEVDALGGEPGVMSARFGGAGLSDEGRNDLLLSRLKGVPDGSRTARFRCAIAVAAPGRKTEVVEGTVEGCIAAGPAGKGGFGYDPVFLPEGLNRTMAELSPEEKDSLSHRARATADARKILREWAKTL